VVPADPSPAVRNLAARDRAAALELLCGSDPWRRLGYERADWERILALPLRGREGHVVTVDSPARFAGIALVRPGFLAGDYLEVLAITSQERGRRLGAVLIEHVERVAFARAKNVFVCVSDFNTRARRFYERQGYAEVGKLPDLLVPGSAELLLRKTTGSVRSR
jgi:ribosomal-protein-alanine N-acetyltransferase